MQTLTLAVYNKRAEIATISLPQQSEANWYYCGHVKLDGAAGVIEFDCNTITSRFRLRLVILSIQYQWLMLTGFILVLHADSGTTGTSTTLIICGLVQLGGRAGVLVGFLHTMSTDGTLSGWAAEGSGATTVVDALQVIQV